MKTPSISLKPWYREPWPWLLMSGPAIVVVAGIFTAYLAVRSQDGLVVDDYYKQGLAVNKDLSRDLAARTARLSAVATMDGSHGRVTLSIVNAPQHIKELKLTLSRAAISGFDQTIVLQRTQRLNDESTFVGAMAPLEIGKWYATLDDPARTWRLLTTISVQDRAPMTFSLGGAASVTAMKPADG